MEQLYVEVLYTIRHKLGAHSAKYPHHVKEDLVHYAQLAFGISHEYHRKCHAIASEEKVVFCFLSISSIRMSSNLVKEKDGCLEIDPSIHPEIKNSSLSTNDYSSLYLYMFEKRESL